MRNLLYLFLFLIVAVFSLTQIYDGDIGHHLKAGEWMLARGEILKRDVFSYTAPGKAWLNHSWLAEIILYYVYASGGINGLILFKVLIVLISYLFILKASSILNPSRTERGDLILAVFFILSVAASACRLMVRPLIFTFLAVALSIYIYARAKKDINSLFFIPLLQFFWTNLHAEFMLGLVMIFIFWLAQIGRHFYKITAVLVLTIGAALLNPFGYKLILHPFTLTKSDLFMTRISEWLPAFHPVFREEGSVWFFYAFLALGLFSFILNFRKIDWTFFLFFITLGLMSLAAIRFMPYFSLIGIPIVMENAGAPLSFSRRLIPGRLRRVLTPALLVFILAWGGVLVKSRIGFTEFGLGLAEKVCWPLRAGEFLEEAKVRGNVFNMCDFGGYLIWRFGPERPVLVDGRLDVYGEELYRDFLEPGEDTLAKYNINYIFLSYRHPATWKLLYENKNWPLVYFDDTTLIYIRNSPKNRAIIEDFGYKKLNPLTGSYGEIDNWIWREIYRALRICPQSVRGHVILGDLYVETKDFDKAISAYEEALDLGRRYNILYMVKIYHALARLYHHKGDYSKAGYYYGETLKRSKRGDSIYSQALEDWGQLLYQKGERRKALGLLKKAVHFKKGFKNYPLSGYPLTLGKLALLYEEIGKTRLAIQAWQEVYEVGLGEARKQAEEHLKSLPGT